MASNPMQRKSRNSFILGVLIAVLVMGAIVAVLLLKIKNMQAKEDDRLANLIKVYALNTNVKSGDTLDASMLVQVETDKNAAPTDAIKGTALTENSIAKIDLSKGMILTASMVAESDNPTTSDLRIQEYNMLRLESQIAQDDYIDVRLRLPNGLDYIVVSKKRVEIPQINGVDSENTIWIKLTEDETLAMSNAIVEAYKLEGAVLYTAKYVEPGTQEKATPTYIPSAEVVNLVTQNPNVVQEAKTAMYNRYQQFTSNRNNINSQLNSVDEDEAKSKVTTGTTTEVTTAQDQRKSYLDALAGY
jgi:hypothetical protein